LTARLFDDLNAPMPQDDSSAVVARAAIASQIGASLAMLDVAMADCPDASWDDGSGPRSFWYILEELDSAGVLPPRAYTRAELRSYADHCRRRIAETAAGLTPESAVRRCRFPWGEVAYVELLLYAMRHVQHHAGQLNLLLRQRTDVTPRWVARGL
jgi:hypothetical protein